ncbi:hypothetical protein [Mycobacterium simulans]|uniref:hypothetical protein n=1 Tax=Mycobacterium simulans TaxID=627089 RepID=UPI00163FFA37|nr:hypothetical protein [Mycobacterium simulans]
MARFVQLDLGVPVGLACVGSPAAGAKTRNLDDFRRIADADDNVAYVTPAPVEGHLQ